MVTLGIEVEAYAKRGNDFVNVLEEVGYVPAKTPGANPSTGGDVGFCQWEGATAICRSPTDVFRDLSECVRRVPEGIALHFRSETPYRGVMPLTRGPRYDAMAEALVREHPRGFNGMTKVARRNALHAHIGVDNVLSDEAMLLLNVTNNIAPYARMRMIRKHEVSGAERQLLIWQGWSQNAARVPAPRWFMGPDHLIGFMTSIPKLIVNRCGEWRPGDGERLKFGHADGEGTCWWASRPRASFPEPTVEWRVFPTLDPEGARRFSHELFRFAEAFCEHAHIAAGAQFVHDPRVKRLYKKLRAASYLVPEVPLDDATWWHLYRQ